MLEQTASLSMSLAEQKCIHMVSWYEEKSERVVKRKISTPDHVYELLYHMLLIKPCENSELVKAGYEDAFRGDNFSSIIVIDGGGVMTVNGAKQELLMV